MAAEFTGDKPYSPAVAILQTPLANTSTSSCLTFNYFVRSSLTVSRLDLDPDKVRKDEEMGHITRGCFKSNSILE